jgi:hypothetical protein
MSCPKCGTKLPHKSLIILLLLTSLLILSFGASLFILPFELFFVFAFILLFALRYIEKQFSSMDKKEVQCPECDHIVNLAHSH